MSISFRFSSAAIAACVVLAYSLPAHADYPERGITFVVPYAAGGSTDIAARLVANGLANRLKTSVVVENKPGSGGLIGAASVANSQPDGYTFLVTGNGLASLPALDDPAFDLQKSLTPVTRFAEGALIILASPGAPFSTIQEFLEYAKANPGEVNGGLPGALGASQLALERFRMESGFEYTPIYYSGNAPAAAALMAGEVELGVDAAPSARSFVESGKILGLAVTTQTRFPHLPDVPTLSETVYPGYSDGYSNIVLAPAGTPEDIVRKVADEIAEIVQEPEVVAKLLEYGLTPLSMTHEQFSVSFQEEIDRYGVIIADLKQRDMLQ